MSPGEAERMGLADQSTAWPVLCLSSGCHTLLKHRKQLLAVELFLQIDLMLLKMILVGRAGPVC